MQKLRDYLEERIPAFDTVGIAYTQNGERKGTLKYDRNMDREAKDYLLDMEELFVSLDDVKSDEIETAFIKDDKLIFKMTMDEFVTLLCDLEDEEEE